MKARYILGIIFVIMLTIIYYNNSDDKKTKKNTTENKIEKVEKKEVRKNKNLLTEKEEEYYDNLDENNISKLSEKELEKIAYTEMQNFLDNFDEIDVKDFTLRTKLHVENECNDDSEIYIYEKDEIYLGHTSRYIDGLIFGGGPNKNFMTTNNTGVQVEEFMKIDDAKEYLNSLELGNFTFKRTTVPKILGDCISSSRNPLYEFVDDDGKIMYMDATPRIWVGVEPEDFFKETKPYFWKSDVEEKLKKEKENPKPVFNPEGEIKQYSKGDFDKLINSDIREKRVKAVQSMTGSQIEELVNIINNDPNEKVQQAAITQISDMEYDDKDIFLDSVANINTDNLTSDNKEELNDVLKEIKNKKGG